MNNRRAFDLTALQVLLKGKPRYKELSKAIDRFAAAVSFEQDLKSAMASVDALLGLDRDETDPRRRGVTGQALMLHAVMMYCRAAIEDGNGRWKMGVTKDFVPDLLKKHQDVVKLRNKSLAHFDVGDGRYGTQWIEERVVMKFAPVSSGVTNVWRGTNYLGRLAYDLRELCSAALERVSAAVPERLAAVDKALNDKVGDVDLIRLMERCPFDPVAFFLGNDVSAENFWLPGPKVHEIHIPKVHTDDLTLQVGDAVTTRLFDDN